MDKFVVNGYHKYAEPLISKMVFMFKTIVTSNLQLTPPSIKDVSAIIGFEERNRDHLAQWETSIFSHLDHPLEEVVEKRLDNWIQECEEGKSIRFFIRPIADPKLIIGFCNYTQIFHGPFQACYLGYKIDHEYEGRGFMFEALEASIRYLFEASGIHRIMANYMPTNAKSAKLLSRLGFVTEGYAKNYLLINNRWEDHVLTALSLEQWQNKQASRESTARDKPFVQIYIAVSIDGYIARKDGGLDWLDRVGGFDEDYGFGQLMKSIDTVILGRKTYEVASTVPDPYPGKRIVVLSRSLDAIKPGVELYRGELPELINRLHKEGAKHVWVDGGSTISQFLSLELVDEMTLSVIPVVLGSGIPLFNVLNNEIPCRLISSESFRSGLVQLNYEIVKQT